MQRLKKKKTVSQWEDWTHNPQIKSPMPYTNWANRQKAFEKVKRKVVETSFEDGGIRMINLIGFQEYLNLQWVGKLFYATDEDNWKQVPFWHLEKLGNRDNIFNINCNSS